VPKWIPLGTTLAVGGWWRRQALKYSCLLEVPHPAELETVPRCRRAALVAWHIIAGSSCAGGKLVYSLAALSTQKSVQPLSFGAPPAVERVPLQTLSLIDGKGNAPKSIHHNFTFESKISLANI